MPNDEQREAWNTEDVAKTWVQSEPISDYGTAPIMEALRLSPGDRVLDVACGGGKTTIAAGRAVGPAGHVVGVDISEGMIALAKTRIREAGLDNVELAHCDAQIDDFPSGPFDAVLSQFGVMFFEDPTAALANVRRHLKPGARAAFVTWQPEERMKWSPAHIIFKYLPPPGEGAGEAPEEEGSWGEAAFARDVLSSAGFSEIQVAERDYDAKVPPYTDIPASCLTGFVDVEHRDAVLREWQETRKRLTDREVMRLDLKINLITARAPALVRSSDSA